MSAVAIADAPDDARWRRLLKGAGRSPAVYSALFLVLIAVFGPLIAPFGPTQIVPGALDLPPSLVHPFGTDSNGMDIFSRVIYATRIDLVMSLLSAALSTFIGTTLGLYSGFYKTSFDPVMRRLMEVLQTFPVVMLAMAILIAVGSSLVNIVLVIALVNIPPYFRTVRAIVAPMSSADFIDAARCTGQSGASIIFRHLLPNVWLPVLAQFTINFAIAVQALAGLSFLGLGVPYPQPEWGLMTKQGAGGIMRGIWWSSFFPGLAVFVCVLTLTKLSKWMQGAADR